MSEGHDTSGRHFGSSEQPEEALEFIWANRRIAVPLVSVSAFSLPPRE